MALTRNFKQTVIERVERDPEFAEALLDEAATLFLSDKPETAHLTLRNLVMPQWDLNSWPCWLKQKLAPHAIA